MLELFLFLKPVTHILHATMDQFQHTIFNKNFETSLHKQLSDFLESNKVVSDNQFGFRMKSNTALSIICFLNDIYIQHFTRSPTVFACFWN